MSSLQIVNLLDMLTQHCAPNTPQPHQALLDLTKETKQQSVILPSTMNGFTLTVETEITYNLTQLL